MRYTRCKGCKLDWEIEQTLSIPIHIGSGVELAHCPGCFLETTRIEEGDILQTIGGDEHRRLPPFQLLLTGLPSLLEHTQKYIVYSQRKIQAGEYHRLTEDDIDFLEETVRKIESLRDRE